MKGLLTNPTNICEEITEKSHKYMWGIYWQVIQIYVKELLKNLKYMCEGSTEKKKYPISTHSGAWIYTSGWSYDACILMDSNLPFCGDEKNSCGSYVSACYRFSYMLSLCKFVIS